jgi:hypothetical protein
MKVRLNLATSSLENNRRFAAGAAVVGGLGVIAMFLLAWHAFSVWRFNTAAKAEQQQIEVDMARLRGQRAELEAFFNQPESVQRRDRAAFLNSLIARRAFPWINVFMALEKSLPEGVRVVSIEPKLVEGHLELRLAIGALNDDGKVKFLKALESSPEFSQIQVLSETRSVRAGDSDHVMVALQARYSAS